MRGRDTDEAHRASSPLELLVDLTFVVAVSQVAAELAERIATGHAAESIGTYLMVFFAIWWAWMNFTWFASAYDTDDVPYRLLTVVQMVGVLVLAAGVPAAFEHADYLAVTLGYLIMRIGLVTQWIRAGIEDPPGRRTAFRYAAGISIVQAGWVLRLLLPPEWGVASFVVLAALDLSVPIWAERSGWTHWHPHHIAERYGLFVIILLGESVLASTNGVRLALQATGLSAQIVLVALSGLVVLVGVWWLYYLAPTGDGLALHRSRSFYWGYGHWPLFAAIAAIGAALEVVVAAAGGRPEGADRLSLGLSVAIPVAVVLVLIWALFTPLVGAAGAPWWVLVPASALIVAVPFVIPDLTAVVAVIAGLVALAVVGSVAATRRHSAVA